MRKKNSRLQINNRKKTKTKCGHLTWMMTVTMSLCCIASNNNNNKTAIVQGGKKEKSPSTPSETQRLPRGNLVLSTLWRKCSRTNEMTGKRRACVS